MAFYIQQINDAARCEPSMDRINAIIIADIHGFTTRRVRAAIKRKRAKKD